MLLAARVNAADFANHSPRVSGNWNLSTDFLTWFASEEASAVWADIIKIGNNTSSFTAQDISFDWDFGFRIGAGYNLEYDQWDTQFFWTWIRSETHQSQTVFPRFIPLPTEFIHPEFFAADLSNKLSQKAVIHWALLFNTADWELGRCYWVSKGLSFRPFIGLKGGWINQSIRVQYDDLIINDMLTADSGREDLKNDFWGIGPLGGMNTKWKLRHFSTHYPSLFGDFSIATLWGRWMCTDTYKDTMGDSVIVNMRKSTLGALMFRGFLGVGWDVGVNKGQSHLAARLGYEMQLWVNQLRLPTSQLIRLHGDLTLQGITFHCRLDF